jgi:hypothetical protein
MNRFPKYEGLKEHQPCDNQVAAACPDNAAEKCHKSKD